jgi:hypothetical protein
MTAKEMRFHFSCAELPNTAKRKGLEGFSRAAGGAGAKRSPEKPGPRRRRGCAQIRRFNRVKIPGLFFLSHYTGRFGTAKD